MADEFYICGSCRSRVRVTKKLRARSHVVKGRHGSYACEGVGLPAVPVRAGDVVIYPASDSRARFGQLQVPK